MTEGLGYDETALGAQLSELTTWQRATFAATCAQRLAPAFRRYAEVEGLDGGVPGVVEEALDELWRALAGGQVRAERIESLATACEAAVPGEEDWNGWADLAEHAAAASVYALRCWVTGDTQLAVWAAQQAYHAADLVASNRLGSNVFDAATERQLWESGPVLRELRSQSEDLQTVRNAGDHNPATVATLRTRSSELARQLLDDAEPFDDAES
jgi:uncharacterized protein YjaG (DUF416 family)